MRLLQSREYSKWIRTLKDRRAVMRINAHVFQIQRNEALCGDFAPVGDGILELRLHFGPGYRVYLALEDNGLVLLLLAGGDKSTQRRDIKKAKAIAARWRSSK